MDEFQAGTSLSDRRSFQLRALRSLAAALLVVYVVWNIYWLRLLTLPPSLFQSLTGLPCPTTGGTRSLLAMYRGDFAESLRYNAMMLPIAALFFASIAYPLFRALRGRGATLPQWFLHAWLLVLGVAWIAKLLGDPQYW